MIDNQALKIKSRTPERQTVLSGLAVQCLAKLYQYGIPFLVTAWLYVLESRVGSCDFHAFQVLNGICKNRIFYISMKFNSYLDGKTPAVVKQLNRVIVFIEYTEINDFRRLVPVGERIRINGSQPFGRIFALTGNALLPAAL